MDSVRNTSQKQLESEYDASTLDAEEALDEEAKDAKDAKDAEDAKDAQNDENYSPELADDANFVEENEFVDSEEDLEDAYSLATKSSVKEKNAHDLEVRRAIEERVEQRQMSAETDYLDLDLD